MRDLIRFEIGDVPRNLLLVGCTFCERLLDRDVGPARSDDLPLHQRIPLASVHNRIVAKHLFRVRAEQPAGAPVFPSRGLPRKMSDGFADRESAASKGDPTL